MKRWLYFFVILAVIVGVAYWVYGHRVWLGWGGVGGGVPTEVPETDLAPAQLVWRGVDRSGDGFRIDMPADTHETQAPAYTGDGGVEQMEMLIAMPNANTTYAVAWDDDPPVERASGEVAERTLDHARDGALARTRTALVKESRDSYMGYPARSFSARNDAGGLLDARLILAGKRLYMMMVALPAASARREGDIGRFFGSFKLIGAAQGG